MWPLLLCSILALAVAIERIVVFTWTGSSYDRFIDQLRGMLRKGGVARALTLLQTTRSPLGHVAASYLERLDEPARLRQEIVSREASYELTRMERRLHWLAVIGHLCPMIGLLGTVVGLVEAFHQIEVVGGQVQPGDLAAGIWKALLTTVFGLVVALPTLAVHHFLDQRVGAVALQMQWLTSHLDEWLDKPPADEEIPAEDFKHEAPVEIGVSAGE
jgi:biopolymer transport protein ExbB